MNKYNNTYHRNILMEPIDIKNNNYTKFGKTFNDKDAKFQVG